MTETCNQAHVTYGLHFEHVTEAHIKQFLRMEILSAVVKLSPSVIYESKSLFKNTALMPEKRYTENHQALSMNPARTPLMEKPQVLETMQNVVNRTCYKLFNSYTVGALDDDKAPMSAKSSSNYLIAARKIKNYSPVLHNVCSVYTQLFISSHLEMVGDKVDDIIEEFFQAVQGVSHHKKVQLQKNCLLRIEGCKIWRARVGNPQERR